MHEVKIMKKSKADGKKKKKSSGENTRVVSSLFVTSCVTLDFRCHISNSDGISVSHAMNNYTSTGSQLTGAFCVERSHRYNECELILLLICFIFF